MQSINHHHTLTWFSTERPPPPSGHLLPIFRFSRSLTTKLYYFPINFEYRCAFIFCRAARWADQWRLDTGLLENLQVALKVEATKTKDWAPFANA